MIKRTVTKDDLALNDRQIEWIKNGAYLWVAIDKTDSLGDLLRVKHENGDFTVCIWRIEVLGQKDVIEFLGLVYHIQTIESIASEIKVSE
jgi:hypothetical protein